MSFGWHPEQSSKCLNKQVTVAIYKGRTTPPARWFLLSILALITIHMYFYRGSFSLLAASLIGSASSFDSTEASTACSALGNTLNVSNGVVQFSSFVSAGTNITFSGDADFQTCSTPSQVVLADLCRIALHVATSNRSEITLEVWLPNSWNGRFMSTGNGGLAGCIQYSELSYMVSMGFAVVGTNNGHNGTSGKTFYKNSDIVHDFASRAVHTGAVIGKQITKAYYGEEHKKSYYTGCSTGGRQGLKSVQEWPEDFDGVIAGAPAASFNNLTSWSGSFFNILGNSSAPTFLTPALWSTVHDEVLDQCDILDGAADGILEDPSLCSFRPEALLCTAGITTNCLTSPQVLAVRKVFSDYHGINGALIYPRMQPGSELQASTIIYNGIPFIYTAEWFKYAIYNDPSWDPTTISVQDAANAAAVNPFNIETWEGDLSQFASRGGKLLTYHGLQDGLISSDNSARYYNHVASIMSLRSSDLDDFYRYFRISGMGHCGGGPGAFNFGQSSFGVAGLAGFEESKNVVLQMVAWVEEGKAPETVLGARLALNGTVVGERKHCKYPKRNVYQGPGGYDDVSGWECV